LIAALFNANPFRKGRAARSEQFHPYLRREARQTKGLALTKHTLKFLAMAMGAIPRESIPE
jgi:hypothetical protein